MAPIPPERPRSEPEIIPPNDPRVQGRNGGMWSSFNGVHRVYVARVGPFGMVMAMLAVGLIAALGVLVLIGTLALLLPLGGLILAILIIAAVLRGPRRR
jgi:hypothetical protein